MSPWKRIAIVGKTTADWASIFASLREAVSKAGLEKEVLIWTCRERPKNGLIDGHPIDHIVASGDDVSVAVMAIKNKLANGRK
ncbi:MAG: hypothetical protein Q7S01_04060 [bacterium]|nr:hypothetical protein [bacterium]